MDLNTGKTFRIITLGCKVNQYESACMRESLLQAGCSAGREGERVDVTVVNTCIVTQRAAHQSRQAVRRAIRENPSGLIAAVGCYAQVYPEELSSIEGLQLIAGNRGKGRVHEVILEQAQRKGCVQVVEDFKKDLPFDSLPIKTFQDRTRAFLKIQDGCEAFCSYCVVPYARGPCRSLDPAGVLQALNTLAEQGYREVVLTGIHLGKYGVDLQEPTTLLRLLRLIGKQGFPLRIRLSSIEPNEVDREIAEMVGSEEWLCRHFHIPLQSGDDGILEKMNRDYAVSSYARLIETIRGKIPLAGIGADVMVGFPGEDEAAFRNTFSLIKDLPLSYLHVFPFSPRKGTPAASLPGRVDSKVAAERAASLRALGREKREAFHRSCLGEKAWVLAEGRYSARDKRWKGLSDNYLPVIFSSKEELKNRLVLTRMEKVEGGSVIGRIVENAVMRPGRGSPGHPPQTPLHLQEGP